MDILPLLKLMVTKGASDLFVTAGLPPAFKLDGQVVHVGKQALSPEMAKSMVESVMDEQQTLEFNEEKDCNFAIDVPDAGRFRVSAYFQRGLPNMVLRHIEENIPKIDALGLPPIVKDLAMTRRGILFIVGATGSGKSTTLASIIGYRNNNSRDHIICLEDPIEFLHQHAASIISQREIGVDVPSYGVALKNTLRQAPNVIMIGEIRSREVMEHAVTFAETGHLVLATLHANNANQALDRIIQFFPKDRANQVWMDLSLNLKGIIAQQLIKSSSKDGRVAALEVLINTPRAADLIRKGSIHELKTLMSKSKERGMQTFDMALFALFNQGRISYDDAISHSDSPNDLRLMIKLDDKQYHKPKSSSTDFSLQDDE